MDLLIIIIITVLGLMLGSFFCCMGYRIPNKINTTTKRSFCPKCKKTLKWYMNIPLISYIVQGGKCAYCKETINIIYPFIEITCSVLFLGSYILFEFNHLFFVTIVLTGALMVTIVSDFMYYYISDRVIVFSIISLIIIHYIFGGANYTLSMILSGIVMFAFMYFIKILGDKIFKKESLGGGDIKLMAVVGMSVGIIPSIFVMLVSSIIGLVFSLFTHKKNSNESGILPFGPFILISTILIIYIEDIFNIFSYFKF